MFKTSRDLAIVTDLLQEMSCAVIEQGQDRRFRCVGRGPLWLPLLFPAARLDGHWFEGTCSSPFLREFLVDAMAVWKGLAQGMLKTEPWSERDPKDEEWHFDARAMLSGDRRVLVLQHLDDSLEARRRVIQMARELRLKSDRELASQKKITEILESHVQDRSTEVAILDSKLRAEIQLREEAERRVRGLQEDLLETSRRSAVGELASGLAHELTQPFSAVTNFLQGCSKMLDQTDPDMDRVREGVAKASEQAGRAGDIIRGIRRLVEQGEPEKRNADLEELVDGVLELMTAEIEGAGIDIEVDHDLTAPIVRVDPIQIQEVLYNLLKNSVESLSECPEEGRSIRVEISRDAEDDFVVTRVRDNGAGCEPESLARLFDSFYSTKDFGMGMGLSISRTIIEAHDGELTASATDDGGLEVSFRIPPAPEKSQ